MNQERRKLVLQGIRLKVVPLYGGAGSGPFQIVCNSLLVKTLWKGRNLIKIKKLKRNLPAHEWRP
jgi:hypothetical protein